MDVPLRCFTTAGPLCPPTYVWVDDFRLPEQPELHPNPGLRRPYFWGEGTLGYLNSPWNLSLAHNLISNQNHWPFRVLRLADVFYMFHPRSILITVCKYIIKGRFSWKTSDLRTFMYQKHLYDITLRILTPPMETPDPPSDTPGASKKVFLTSHGIPRILRVS